MNPPKVMAVARAMSDNVAASCEYNAERHWKAHGSMFIEDAEVAVKAMEAFDTTASAQRIAELETALAQYRLKFGVIGATT